MEKRQNIILEFIKKHPNTNSGAIIDYVITGIDRESDCCTASRRSAMYVRRKGFTKLTPRVGKKVPVNVLAVGSSHLLATCGGYDMTLSQRDLS